MLALTEVDEGLTFRFLTLNRQWAASLVDAQLTGGDAAAGAAVAGHAAALEELASHDGIPFFALARRCALTGLESQVVGLCLAQMMEPELGRALAPLHAHGQPRITPAVVAQLLLGNTPEARTQVVMLLSAESRLRTACILEAPQLVRDGLIDSALYLTRACLAYLTGQAIHTPSYRFTRFAADPAGRAAKRAVVAERQAEQIYDVIASQAAYLHGDAAVAADGAWILLLLWGPAGAGKATFARELAGQFFSGVVELDGEAATQLAAPHVALRDALDCAVVHDAMLLIENGHALLRGLGAGRLLLDALRASPACVVVTSTERALGQALEAAWSMVAHVPRPAPARGVELWKTHLPPGTPLTSDVDLDALSARYALSAAAIARAARMAAAYSAADPEPAISMAQLEQAAVAQLDDELGGHADTVWPHHTLDDLILPADDVRQLGALIAGYPHAHRGPAPVACITVVVHGEPGTGKSFAAEVIAGAIGRPLHVVDPAGGERELRAVFEHARRGHAVLLFDDAGPLLASAVLRHELDRHRGLVIVTAQSLADVDPALRRRAVFCLRLAPPDEATRRRLWQRLLPAAMRGHDVDLIALAGHALTGGEIKTAILRASLACGGGRATQRQLMDACARERSKHAPDA